MTKPTDLVAFRHHPANVAEAMELAVRIDAVRAWLSDLRESVVKGYITDQAEAFEQGTGASFRAPVKGLGLVYRTDPKAKPRIVNQELFGRWYVQELLDEDPDRDGAQVFVQFDERVGRRLTAAVDPVYLLRWVNADAIHQKEGSDDSLEMLNEAAAALVDHVAVDVEWLVGDATLDALLAGKLHGTASEPCIYLAGGTRIIERTSGEVVPGVGVTPPGDKTVVVKPEPDAKERIRQELDRLLGPAELQREDHP